jgi:cytochrome b6-f complex iron-sulfur subunit
MGRRRFLARLEAVAAGVTGAALPFVSGACAARAAYVTPISRGDRLAIPAAEVSRSGALVEDPGGGLPIFVHRSATGVYLAVSTRCGHQGCQVEPAGERLVCPCHGSEYLLDGTILQGPTQRPLERFGASLEGDTIFIQRLRPGSP